jgi:DNA-binding Lrp family transcriptional regulator
MAQKAGVSSNTVKRRVRNLIRDGIIEQFVLAPSLAMADAEYAVCFVINDEYRFDNEFIDKIAAYPGIVSVGYDNSGSYVVYAEFSEANGLLELRSYLEGLKGVKKVLIHPIPAYRGEKTNFTDAQLDVLRSLYQNPRKSYHAISKDTGLSVKRVRKLVNEIVSSKAISFGLRVNLQSSKNTVSVMSLKWNPKETTPEIVAKWLEEEFTDSFYTVSFSANESLAYAFHIFESLNETLPIVQAISEFRGIKLEGMGVVFIIRTMPGLRGTKLKEMLHVS